ncbi:unnamed protein product [Cuscuta campestris]|uniref:Uncharacterized protein n=1 Tax=Cuscuta campestris TaxID=132261 RepID=A0A484KLC2_9ASTE|nr:unnamed protein product [Cuscuta campestris]
MARLPTELARDGPPASSSAACVVAVLRLPAAYAAGMIAAFTRHPLTPVSRPAAPSLAVLLVALRQRSPPPPVLAYATPDLPTVSRPRHARSPDRQPPPPSTEFPPHHSPPPPLNRESSPLVLFTANFKIRWKQKTCVQAQFFELSEEARQKGLQVTDQEIRYSLVVGRDNLTSTLSLTIQEEIKKLYGGILPR